MDWALFKGVSVSVTAEPEGVLIRRRSDTAASTTARFERILPPLLVQLEDMELGFNHGDGWCIPYAQFVDLEAHGINAFETICKWSPLTLELESRRWLGAPEFQYVHRFYAGGSPVGVERRGCFIAYSDELYRLDADWFHLINAIDEYNQASPDTRSSSALLQFCRIKGLATTIGAKLDNYLSRERVLLPSKLAVDIVAEPDGRISFVPKIEGVPQGGLTRAFFSSDDVESVYAIDDESGGRIRVIFDTDQQEVLRRIQRVRHLGGKARADVLRDPTTVFDGVSGHVEFAFGPRVTGVGDFPFTIRPYVDARTGIFDGSLDGRKRPEYGLECRYADGAVEHISFSSRDELLQLRNNASAAERSGAAEVEFRGKSLAVNRELLIALDNLVDQEMKPRAKKEPAHSGKYVLIYTNESQLDFQLSSDEAKPSPKPALPTALTTQPKKHQCSGYDWLRGNCDRQRTGCLLADDMGLGKTFQVLLLVASLIEAHALTDGAGNPELPPWNPVLIVAPVILIENRTWQSDMQAFFADEGSVFDPVLVLHGSNLKRYRRAEVQGRETAIGQPVLDLEEIRRFKVVITNYETVINYQHSLARMRWTAVVTDEAQEYKTPSTKISHALKALNARFRIACTGTPVETRLFDIWNLFDFLEPGPLLGSASEFRKEFEPTPDRIELPKLKQRLKLGSDDAHLLRRNKDEVLELPPKHEHYLDSVLSQEQIDWHLDLLSRRSADTARSHPFSILHNLMKLYQHPFLMSSLVTPTGQEALRQCPKLRSVIECLKQVRARSEKALVFTRSIDMQQLLALTCEEIFGFRIHIVNGATGKDSRQGISNSRRAVVDGFRKSPGFNVLILSPDVAGIGLTIVEANHVIHYGRWWNPAKESQATDRVYRIGQTKPVHVYYPVAKHPTGQFVTFDEKLDSLLIRRKQLAADFLAPMPTDEDLQSELLQSLGVSGTAVPPDQLIGVSDLQSLTWDRFEALVALIEKKAGRRVLLSPKSGDGGIDVIARLGSEVRLLQCKHTQWMGEVTRDMIAELITSSDAFRSALDVISFTARPVLVTNANVPRSVFNFAHDRDVEVVSAATFAAYLGGAQCSRAEVEAMERERYASLARLRADLTESFHIQAAGA